MIRKKTKVSKCLFDLCRKAGATTIGTHNTVPVQGGLHAYAIGNNGEKRVSYVNMREVSPRKRKGELCWNIKAQDTSLAASDAFMSRHRAIAIPSRIAKEVKEKLLANAPIIKLVPGTIQADTGWHLLAVMERNEAWERKGYAVRESLNPGDDCQGDAADQWIAANS